MIPLKLSLNNFLCYRENVPTLDFAGMHVACLCGPNGHGKSALLDGITWALWGKARGKTQDEMISYGADECRVELDFGARDQSYRIIRSHARSGARRRRGPSDLQVMLLDGAEPTPLTGDTIRETQARIDQTVGMDYDTFINSAFLLQGRSDEFTTRTPAERKAVLSKIIGLETYDRLQARSRERGDWAKNTALGIEATTIRIWQELDQLEAPAAELAQVEERLELLERDLVLQREKNASLREKIAELRRFQAQQHESQQRVASLSQELLQLEAAERAVTTQIAQFEELIAQGDEVRRGAARLAEARVRHQQLEQSRVEFDSLQQQKSDLQRAIDVARARLESEANQLRLAIDTQLAPQAQGLEQLQTELDRVRGQEPELATQQAGLATSRERLTHLSTKMGEIKSSLDRLKAEGIDINAKLELLDSSNGNGAACPLCQTPLSEDGCGRLADSYRQDVATKRDDYRRANATLTETKTEFDALGMRVTSQETELARAQTDREVKLRDLEQRISESRQADQALQEAQPRLAALQDSLATGGFAADETHRLAQLEERVRELGYDDAARQASYADAQQLEGFADRLRSLDQAEAGLPGAKEALAQNAEMAERRRQEMDRLKLELAQGESALTKLPPLEAELAAEDAREKSLDLAVQEAIERRGNLRGQVARKTELTEQVRVESARLAGLQDEQSVFQELATAFGRQGVQAMLIETVVPMLEEEANGLLGRMTDNRMNVKLETQRERASGQGEPRETLEIYVSDELGPRSYEMYSGGEAFRVNLALRIALSRVLAQRMGAPLPTLFIDEGFGTQDAVGRERILDVISAIGNDFEKIIVITHLEDLKEAFPVRIEVQKDAAGSTFWLS